MCLGLRMESKPWRKIQTARKFCAWTGEGDGLPQSEAEVLEMCGDSPVLSVYTTVHALNKRNREIVTSSATATSVLLSDQSLDDALESEEMSKKALCQYRRCPDSFRVFLKL